MQNVTRRLRGELSDVKENLAAREKRLEKLERVIAEKDDQIEQLEARVRHLVTEIERLRS
jgi:uncharacterized coiled-coil protein SlyX